MSPRFTTIIIGMADRRQMRKEFLQLFLLVHFSEHGTALNTHLAIGRLIYVLVSRLIIKQKRWKGAGWKCDEVRVL